MTGRAGRRGQDKIGFMLAVPGRFMDITHVRKLLFKDPEDIVSQIRNDFSMILNLLLSQTPEDIRDDLRKIPGLLPVQPTGKAERLPQRGGKPLGRLSAPSELLKSGGICG